MRVKIQPNHQTVLLLFAFCFLLAACSNKKAADLLIVNATVYTVDSAFAMAEAMAVKDGKIIATGTTDEIQSAYDTKNVIDAKGQFVYPGLIDAHAHFVSYGLSLQSVDLTGTESWSECITRVKDFVNNKQPGKGQWIVGGGWDQNDWQSKEYPPKDSLDILFPDNPVILSRIDGHAAIANDMALNLAGLKPGMQLTGGDIEVSNGKLTGILIDNAVDLVSSKVPASTPAALSAALLDAQANCFSKGLTTVDDCGLSYRMVIAIDSMHKAGKLKMKIYAMLSDAKDNYDYLFTKGKIKTERLNVRAFKIYADGALGSRGACLLSPYTDRANHFGFLLSDKQHFDSVANLLIEKDFQMCTHAIGDSGNRQILNTYGRVLKGPNDKRWRIEHAQVVNSADFELFGRYSVIPSVQPTHATSDMYWAGERLGKDREKGAYAFKNLMQQNGWIALGTDFPVEDIDPLKTFYAAVVRKDSKGWPDGGYQTENALSREEALKGMTIWAAKSNFEEHEKGSLEVGKSADFIILDKDLMKIDPDEILKVSVLRTFVNGETVYNKK